MRLAVSIPVHFLNSASQPSLPRQCSLHRMRRRGTHQLRPLRLPTAAMMPFRLPPAQHGRLVGSYLTQPVLQSPWLLPCLIRLLRGAAQQRPHGEVLAAILRASGRSHKGTLPGHQGVAPPAPAGPRSDRVTATWRMTPAGHMRCQCPPKCPTLYRPRSDLWPTPWRLTRPRPWRQKLQHTRHKTG